MQLAAVRRPVSADDFRLRHKTTDRSLYADVLKRGGTFAVLMIDQQSFLTEGCFSTIFVERGAKLVTPPLSRGLLRGVLRRSLIDMGEAGEGDVRLIDLANGMLIGKDAQGVVAAPLVETLIR